MRIIRVLLAASACILMIEAPSFSLPGWVEDVVYDPQKWTAPREATAVVLYNVTDVEISSKGSAKSKVRIAYKILSSAGEDFGTMSQKIYPFLEVKDLKGWTVKIDGSSKPLPTENIVTVGLQESAGYYDDSQMVIATLPGLEPDVIVAFEYTVEEKGWTTSHQSFTFQIQQPVKFARYSVKIPKNWKLIQANWRTEDLDFEQQENRYVWTANDLPYQPEEPLAPPWFYLSRRIALACFDPNNERGTHFADWPSVARWCADVYDEPALANDEVISQSRRLTAGATTFEERLRAIAAFSQDDIRYVAIEIGKGRWKPRPAAATLLNRYGDCKDKTTLMRALLEALDIRSAPVLASVSYPVDSRLPSPFQFDHCIIAIPIEGEELSPRLQKAVVDDWLFFDPTEQRARIGELPWSLQGGRMLLGTRTDSVLLRLPYPNPGDYRRVYHAKARIDEYGSFTADVRITDTGGWASRSRFEQKVTPEKKQIEKWRATMAKTVPDVELTDYQAGEAEDSVWVSFTIRGHRYVQETGDLSFLHPDLFHAGEPSQLTADEREFPVWFGPPKEIESAVSWYLPDSWIAEADTAAILSDCRAASIFSRLTQSDSTVHIVTRYMQNGELVWPEEYESARRFSRDLSSVRGQVVLIRKEQGQEDHE